MYEDRVYQATLANRHYGPHSEFLVSIQGESIGRYSRTAYATNLLAFNHPVPGTSYGDRPYQINVNDVEFEGYPVKSSKGKDCRQCNELCRGSGCQVWTQTGEGVRHCSAMDHHKGCAKYESSINEWHTKTRR